MELKLLCRIQKQINNCYKKYGKYASFHEAMAVLFEEINELWDECKKKDKDFTLIEKEIIDCITVLFKMHDDIVVNKNNR